jgi:ATP-dependent protease ClpP protease subunit
MIMPHKLIVGDELVLYGDVGDFGWSDEDHFTAREVIEALHEMGRGDVSVRLNSGGGLVSEGTAIFNALKAHPGEVTMYVDGIAASAASVVAMAGDLIVMRPGSLMMIHDPSGLTLGTAEDHRGTANVLDKMGDIAASIYAERSDKSAEEIRNLMLAETWLDGQEAEELGFADEVESDGEATAYAAFDYTLYQKTPDHILQSAQRKTKRKRPVSPAARSAQPKELAIMSKATPVVAAEIKATETDGSDNALDVNYQAVLKRLDAAEAKMAAAEKPVPSSAAETVAEPRDVTREIMSRCRAAKMTLDQTYDVIDKAGNSVDKAKDLIIASVLDREPAESRETAPHITPGADGADRFKEGATRALLFRAGMEGGEVNEFTSMKLDNLAREHLRRRNVTMNFRTPLEMAGEAFRPYMTAGQHSTSDFVEILANVANKAMLKGYMEGEETFDAWTARGVLTDFKAEKRVDLNLFPSLAEVPEGAEYTYGTIGDRGESIQLATYGKMFAITRQAVVNDDLNAFTRIPARMGRAARRTVGNLVYAVLTDNAAMADNIALFHANHSNLAGSGAAPNVTTLDAGRASMAIQTDPDGHAVALNIRPRYFLVPVELEGVASTLMNSEFDPAKTQRTPNHVRGLATVISDGRLSANSTKAWYLAADPMQHDTIEVAYLNGNDQPMLEQRDGWNVDGVEFKVRIDAGVKALDFRGLYKNAGE